MALKASLVITGDTASAQAAVDQLDSALDRNATTAQRAGAANDDFGRRTELSARKAVTSAGQIRAGYTQLGQQAQDVAVQLQMGTNIGTIVAQQGTQVATAVAMMGGRFANLASFLAGPLGTAVIVGAGVLLNQLVPALMSSTNAARENADALGKVGAASDGVGAAQSAMAGMFDLATGTIEKQNGLLRANIALKAAQLRAEAMAARSDAREAMISAGQMSWGAVWRNNIPLKDAWDSRSNKATANLKGVMEGKISPEKVVTWAAGASFDNVGISREDYLNAVLRAAEAGPKDATADAMLESLQTGALDPMFLKPTKPTKPSKPTKPAKSPDLGEFGEDIAARITRISDQFSDLPPAIARSNDALRQLDDIASDVEKKRPPNYATIKESLAGAREAVQASLVKPLEDYLEKAQQTAVIDRLVLSGKRDQAVALQDALALQRQMGPLTEEQLAAILDTVVAERERGELLQRHQEAIGNYLDATRSVRGEVDAILSGTGSIANLPQIMRNLQGKVLAEKLFGPLFRDLDRWVQDNSGMKDATTAYVDSTATTASAALDLAAAFGAAGGKIRAAAEAAQTPIGTSSFDAAFADIAVPGVDDSGSYAPGITVTAELPSKPGSLLEVSVDEYMRRMTTGMAGELTDALNGAFGTTFFSNLTGALAGAMQGYLLGGTKFGAGFGLAKGLFDEFGPSLLGNAGKGISDALDKGLKGVATGAQISGLASAFGIKLNNTGAQIGGAIGSVLPIPGGEIIGSIAGGLLGNLFGKRPRGAGAVTSSGVTGSTNDSSLTQSLLGQGSDLQGAIASIAERLGATVGSYDVGLGRYKDYYQVSSVAGDPRLGNSYFGRDSRNSLYDGTDPAKAAAAALAEAIRDGAIQGVSDRVNRALRSNSDIDKALSEAMKVQELEDVLEGFSGSIEKAFSSFERQAKERVRIATAYGFDVVKIEELNAKERLKLSEQLLEGQVGSLQRLIDEMTGGALFEGSAVDRRSALLEQIDKAKIDVDAGTEGAGDKLARLFDQLNAVSKDVYGTTGGFAADRGAILDQARDSISKANQRIAEAQAKSDPALATTNAALDENNDQNAKLIAIANETNQLLGNLSIGSLGGLGTSGASMRLIDIARTNSF